MTQTAAYANENLTRMSGANAPLTIQTARHSGSMDVDFARKVAANVRNVRTEGDLRFLCRPRNLEPYSTGFSNFSKNRSDSPMAMYFSRSSSPSASTGGNVHTPRG